MSEIEEVTDSTSEFNFKEDYYSLGSGDKEFGCLVGTKSGPYSTPSKRMRTSVLKPLNSAKI
jgi:hypothetical protein